MLRLRLPVFVLFLAALIGACAQWQPVVKDPQIRLEGITLDTRNFLSPTLIFDLHISNPNAFALPVKGLSYTVDVLDTRVLSGVDNGVGRIEAFGEKRLTLKANTDLPSLLSLVQKLRKLSNPSGIAYRAEVVIEPEGWLPTMRLNKEDVVSLR